MKINGIEIFNHQDMKRPVKYIYYPIVLFRNVFINKIPSRHFRKIIDILLGARIGMKSFLFRRTEMYFPKGIFIGDYTTIGWFSLLDARGGLYIGNKVVISSYVKIITGSHDTKSSDFQAVFKPVIVEDYVWIGTGAIILQGVKIEYGSVVAAGSVVTKDVPPFTIVAGVPAQTVGYRNRNLSYEPKTDLFH